MDDKSAQPITIKDIFDKAIADESQPFDNSSHTIDTIYRCVKKLNK